MLSIDLFTRDSILSLLKIGRSLAAAFKKRAAIGLERLGPD
jgi:hypothetical protein